MALQSSGLITLSDIQDEFGGVNPISLSEYYRSGGLVTSNNTQVPTAGQIGFSQFYSGVKMFYLNISENTQEADVAALSLAAGWDGAAPITVNIGYQRYVWSDSTSTAALIIPSSITSAVIVNNNGYIIGKGGRGASRDYFNQVGEDGGSAILNQAGNVTIVNFPSSYIAGGGGGGGHGYFASGGGGAGGGDGGIESYAASPAGIGGAIGQSGTDGSASHYGRAGFGGGGGGGGGTSLDVSGAQDGGGSGGGGGRIIAGTGGAGGYYDAGLYGGNGGGVGSPATTGAGARRGGGGGFWGAAGANGSHTVGGAGGAAISGTSVSLTNYGTIYGAVA